MADDICIIINEAYANAPEGECVRLLPKEGIPEGTTEIYNARNLVVITADDKLCIKKFQVPGLIKSVIYGYLRRPKAQRAWNNAFELLKRGEDTPTPVGMVMCRSNGLLTESYYVTLALHGWSTLRGIEARDDFDVLARHLAQYISNLVHKGIYMKDFTPGNVLFQAVEGGFKFCLVDINRMTFDCRFDPYDYFRSPVDTREGTAAIAREYGLLISPDDAEKAAKIEARAMQAYDKHQDFLRRKRSLKKLFK